MEKREKEKSEREGERENMPDTLVHLTSVREHQQLCYPCHVCV